MKLGCHIPHKRSGSVAVSDPGLFYISGSAIVGSVLSSPKPASSWQPFTDCRKRVDLTLGETGTLTWLLIVAQRCSKTDVFVLAWALAKPAGGRDARQTATELVTDWAGV